MSDATKAKLSLGAVAGLVMALLSASLWLGDKAIAINTRLVTIESKIEDLTEKIDSHVSLSKSK